jgi:hypothetical protein
LFGVFLFILVLSAVSVNVSAAAKCKVQFYAKNGKTEYTTIAMNVKSGTTITLPKCSGQRGYKTTGWTTAYGKTKPLYKFGSTYKITKDTKFYIVRIPLYTVEFVNMNGASNSAFQALSQRTASGSSVTLPKLPTKKNYTAMGWAESKNASSAAYKAGQTYTVKKNIKLYAVYKPTVTVTYLSNDGKEVYKTVSTSAGSKVTMYGIVNPSGYTMLGWSASPNQTTNPTYLVRARITIKTSIKLYAVMYPHSAERNYTASQLEKLRKKSNVTKYSKVIFVGDSRTYQLERTMQTQFSDSVYSGVSFVGKGGAGITWIEPGGAGYKQLMAEIGTGGTKDKPIAVIFNFGVNDITPEDRSHIDDYIPYMQKLAAKLQKKNCKLFYMSVNPCNNDICIARGITRLRPESDIRSFNNMIKTGLCGTTGAYTYIDTYTVLMNTGYSMNSGSGVDDGYDDGVHYTTKTYKRIYAYCLSKI